MKEGNVMEKKESEDVDSNPSYVPNYLCDFFFIFYLFVFNLLGWHQLIKFCRFQVYTSTIHHLYIVLCVYHSKSSFFLSPFTPFPFTFFYLPPCPSLGQSPYRCVCVTSEMPLNSSGPQLPYL